MTRFQAALWSFIFVLPAGLATAQQTQPSHARHRVIVLPFTSLNDAGPSVGLAKSIQHNLETDLAMSREIEVIPAGDAGAAPDNRAAIDAARRLDADYVVFGNVQVSDPEVRVSGQVLDVRRDEGVVGRLRATGTVHDLFRVEDRLTMQVDDAIGVRVPREIMADQPPRDEGAPRDERARGNDSQPSPQPSYGQSDYPPAPYYGPTTYTYEYPAYGYAYPTYAYPAYGGLYLGFGYGYPYYAGYGYFGHGYGYHGGYYRGGYGYRGSYSHGSYGGGFRGSFGGSHGFGGGFHGSSGGSRGLGGGHSGGHR